MQAMPAIPIEPMVAAAPAESLPSTEANQDGQFSQHLAAASQNIAGPGTKPENGNPVTAAIDTVEEPGHPAEGELARLAQGDITLAMAFEQNQQASLQHGTPSRPVGPEQAAQILSLRNSIQIPGTATQLENGEKPGTTLASLLGKTVALNNEQQVSVDLSTRVDSSTPSSGQTTAMNTRQNNAQIEPTIENWRAQFSYQSATGTQRANNLKIEPAQIHNTGEGIIRKPVLAYVSPEVEEVTVMVHGKNGSGVELPSQRQDANSHFIHSNLPNVSTKTEGNGNNGTQQQAGEGQKNMGQNTIPQPEQAMTAKIGQDTPLIFSLNQETTPGLTPQSQTTQNSLMLRLPSGTEVPHNQIVDQVIDRFTLNRTLESGSVTLKLHPAELGELRMEIKVEQDNIKAHITTQNPQVQEILDRHLPRLREALEQQGLNLEHMKVTVANDDGSSNNNLFQEHFSRQQSNRSLRSNNNQVAFSLDHEEPEENNTNDQQTLSVHI